MTFKDPLILTLIPLVLVGVWWLCRKHEQRALRFPASGLVTGLASTWKAKLAFLPRDLRILSVLLFMIALAGPRSVLEEAPHETLGIDIVLAIDASGSMAAEDFTITGKRYNRLQVVKNVVEEFVGARGADRIGLVAFAGLAYTVSPLTMDHVWLKSNLERVELNMMEDGTAIGSAIAASLSRLKNSKAQSRVLVLLTDGVNNRGNVDPLAAAQAAKSLGVKIYTIGAGTNGLAPFPVRDIWGRQGYQNVEVEIDEQTLKKIAEITGGQYFRATDTQSLREIYRQIDRLEKTKIQDKGYREYRELFGYVLWPALLILLLAVILEHTLLVRLP